MSSPIRLSRITALSLLLCAGAAYAVADAGARPIPRVEVGMHTSYIKKLSVDSAGQLMLTVSDDKTARLWQASTGKLLHTLRVPIDDGHEGQLYAGALSPGGQIAAVGGYTSGFLQGNATQAVVYFFDTHTGAVRSHQAIDSDKAIENIAFSLDSSKLAICLADGAGVRIYDLKTRSVAKSEAGTTDKILGAAFGPNGDLAITTLDGRLWMFRAAVHYETTHVELHNGRRPIHVQFSPDGAELAVGFEGDPAISIVDARTLKEVGSNRLPESAGQLRLTIVEWSDNGQYIYAGGEGAGSESPVFRFGDHGRGPAEQVLTLHRRVSDIRRLPKGAIAATSGAPEMTVIESSNETRWFNGPQTLDLRRVAASLHSSASGDAVTFGALTGNSALEFDVTADPGSALKRVAAYRGPPDDLLAHGAWRVVVSDDGERMTINDHAAALDHREQVREWQQSRDGRALVVGTSWSLRQYDALGRLQWETDLPCDVSSLATSDDGRAIIAALTDGTIRWFRPEDGREYLSLFVSRNGTEWIAWIPSGYYVCSASGDTAIGWHVNRGADTDPDFYLAVQFERMLYRPDLVHSWFAQRGYDAATRSDARPGNFDIANLDSVAPPRLEVVFDYQAPASGLIKAHIVGHARGLPMKDWSLYVNGIPVVAAQALTTAEQETFTRDAIVQLNRGANDLRVESDADSASGQSLGIGEAEIDGSTSITPPPGDLYLVAIGVNKFEDTEVPGLRYASADADAVARTFQGATHARYRTVHTLLLSDTSGQRATVSNVRTIEPFLASVKSNDTVVLFLSSHGISDSQGNYYFIPADARWDDMESVISGGSDDGSLISWRFFDSLLRHTLGYRILVVDTCFAGNIKGTFDESSLAKRSMASSYALLTATKGNEFSQEMQALGHGLFTYGWLQALETGYDSNGDGVTSLDESFQYASDVVQQQHVAKIGSQTPLIQAPKVLRDMALAIAPPPAK